MLDQIEHREPWYGLFYYDIYSVHRGVGDAVGGPTVFVIERVGGMNGVIDGQYMTTTGFKHDPIDSLLLLNTVPPGMYFYHCGLTLESIKEALATSQSWWWPAWLPSEDGFGRQGLVFEEETDLVIFAGLDVTYDRP